MTYARALLAAVLALIAGKFALWSIAVSKPRKHATGGEW